MEEYGLSKRQYRDLIENEYITAVEIAKLVKMPDRIFRYRRLGIDDKLSGWAESKHWKDDVNGICMFSIPDAFHKNDNDDCKVRFDNKVISNYMFRYYNRSKRRKIHRTEKSWLEKYKGSLQGKLRVGCFTSVEPLNISMWDDPNFGDSGRGLCIEYQVDDENFRPDELSFLPVLYDDIHYDSTEAMKAVVDYAENNYDSSAARKMVCLGYGHTLIKPCQFEKEQEWRLVIPIRDDGAHLAYFSVDQRCKRDMSSAIRSIYLGHKMKELPNYLTYRSEIKKKWEPLGISIFEMVDNNGILQKEAIV